MLHLQFAKFHILICPLKDRGKLFCDLVQLEDFVGFLDGLHLHLDFLVRTLAQALVLVSFQI